MQGYHHEPHHAPGRYTTGRPQLHQGVQQFMTGVYAWMAVGIAITAAVVWGVSQSPTAMATIYNTPLRWVVMFAPLGMALFLPSRIASLSAGAAFGAFAVFASTMGAALAYIPHVYAVGSIAVVFVATVAMFALMAGLGFVTKKDLSGVGQFLIMALFGVIIASIVNIFFVQNVGMGLLVSALIAVISAGLTAYHTQAIKQLYLVQGQGGNLAILGALLLYVNFINLFLSLLHLFGGSRN